MSTEFDDLDGFLSDIIDTLEPSARAKVLRKMGINLRRRNQKRITAQMGPDGTKWVGRKDGSRKKMMQGLKLARNLKMKSSTNHVTIGWKGKMGGIARVHHYGLRDRVAERGVRVKYDRRELLGMNKNDTHSNHEILDNWLVPD